ncbi:hypothetical protein [Solimonas marina]|uniref:Uncharacterized protein n=1 Tax=Solimonas marina TaxID=2714601 RepID=A0A970B6X3_9GAMM|nr:hypothetical protein [Solimonas marina]NKF23273.1 hypothetical protein [Solimonas marina]
MNKWMIRMSAATLAVALAAPAFAQSSGTGATSGSSGTSGSAGLGIDYAALVAAGGTGNPGVGTPGPNQGQTLGGPIAGLQKQFSKPYGQR